MTAPHWYRGHGLLICSDLDLPEFSPAAPGNADLTIRLSADAGTVKARENPPEIATGAILKTAEGALLDLPRCGTFLVRDGNQIDITPVPDHDPGLVRLYLIGSVMGMLFHQRGNLVLHGAAIARAEGITVFVGDSGAGKSTLAAHLGAMGHAVLADDTLVLHPSSDGMFVAWPGSRVFKLWEDAVKGLGAMTDGLDPIANRKTKFFYENPEAAPDRPLPLDEIILLAQGDGAPHLEPLGRLEAMAAISENTYRPEYIGLLGRGPEHFRTGAQLTTQISAYRLTRPWQIAAMADTMDLLSDHWHARTAAMANL